MFSVVIPYYNKLKYITRCIDSVLNQTFRDFEIIIIDDGSTDGGVGLIEENYTGRIKLIRQKNSGVAAARNRAIEMVTSPFTAFLDADDFWHPEYLQTVADVIEKERNSEIKIIGVQYTRNKKDLNSNKGEVEYFRIDNYFKIAIKNTLFTSSSTIINTNFFKFNDGFNPLLERGEDIDVWIRAVVSGGYAYFIKNIMVYYSDEDKTQATRIKADIGNMLIGTINTLYKPILSSSDDKDFKRFISKYVYFNLYPYYFDLKFHNQALESLKKNEYKFFLPHMVYWLPFRLGVKMIKNEKGTKLLRLYLKFVFRYLIR